MSVFDLFGKEPKSKTGISEREELLNSRDYQAQDNKPPVAVFSPTDYQEVEKIIDTLKTGKSCVVHLTEIKQESSIRIIDMLSGAVYALGGGVYEMSKNVFMFSPSGVEIN